MNNKIAIIAEGGGMRCAYSAGVLAALGKELKFTNPEIIIGTSGSVGSLAYYVSGQYDSIRNIWTNLLVSKKFLSLSRFYRIMDIDYLIDVVFKQQDPLLIDKLKASDTKLFLGATNYKTGQAEYFSNKDDRDFFEALRASKAIPIIYNKKVKINGQYFIDGDISSSLEIKIKKAVDAGANKIFVIKDGKGISTSARLFWRICSFFMNRAMRREINNYVSYADALPTFSNNIEIFEIEPSSDLPINSLDNNLEHLIQTFNLGYNDVVKNTKLKAFLL